MAWYMAILSYFWDLLRTWLSLFTAPIKDPSMLWILIPIYLGWIFSEAFQEKKGTSFGNAVSNAVVVFWAAIDWSRTSVNFFKDEIISLWNFVGKIVISVLVLIYGSIIVYEGLKGNNLTHYIGRIRVVSYIVIVITPLVYNTIELDLNVLIAIILFFPLFYFIVEAIDRLTPDPTPITKDNEGGNSGFGGDSFGSKGFDSKGGDEFGLGGSSDLGKNDYGGNLEKDFKI